MALWVFIVVAPAIFSLNRTAFAQETTPTLEPRTGELATDDPPVNFRVTGYNHDTVGLAWEVPRDRGITSYVLQRYKHDGGGFVSSGSAGRIEDETNGGAGHGWALGNLEADTLYKYVLMLKDDLDTTVIEQSVTVRTSTTEGPTLSTDATLSSLSLSGVDIGPFTSGDTYYTATVANSVTQTTVSATTNHSEASYVIKLGGVVDEDGMIPLRVGSNAITVSVTAEDGVTTKIYTVTVTREGLFSTDATLSALTLSGIDFGTFDSATTQYTARVSGVSQTTVSATANHSGASYEVKLNGVVDDDGVISLAVGSNVITVEVTAEDDSTTRTYTITVTRFLSADATLSGLTLSDVTLSFDRATTQYTARVANGVTQTTVTPTVNHSAASYEIKLGGVVDADGVIPLTVGRNVITVEVTAENGSTTRTYTVTVIREVVTGELATDDPPVNFRVTGYNHDTVGLAWEVPRDRGITSYVLQRYKHDGGGFVSSGSAGRIEDETNGGAGHGWALGNLEADTLYKYVLMLKDDLDTTVIEQSVTVRTLTTDGPTLSTDATLSSLSLSGVDIGPFTSGDTYYTATVANSVTQTTVSATTNHSEASYVIKLGGVVDDDGVIPLRVGSNAITVSVTAEDGVTTKIYTVTVTREGEFSTDATLSSLTLSGVDFGTFDSATTQYTAQVSNLAETTVAATVNHSGASYVVKTDGVIDGDRVISLAVGSNVITIEVTAEDDSTMLTYTISVTRIVSSDASLRDLTLSGVTLSFDRAMNDYAASVANDVTQTTVTPTVNDAGARYEIKLGGVVDADGVIPLSVGRNDITVEVTAEDRNTTQTYSVIVTRDVVTGELATDDPPVNFRVTGYNHDTVGLAWEVPDDRGITSYVLQKYKHDGSEFVSSGSAGRIEGETNGGAAHAWSLGNLEADTLYKYTLTLKDDLDTTVIESSVTVRTLMTDGGTLSTDATLSVLTLSDIDELQPAPFSSGFTSYTATVANTVTETTVTATVNHSGASYEVKLGGLVDDDGVIPLKVGRNAITVVVTAEDGTTTRIYTVLVNRADVQPEAPTISRVAPGGGYLTVIWTAPTGTEEADVTSYDVRYIESGATNKADANWSEVDDAWTEGPLRYTITGLSGGTQFDVQVRAVKDTSIGPWSQTFSGTPTTPSACVTGGAVTDPTNTGLVSDCETLLAARDALAGTATLDWSVNTPITQWEGVALRGTPQRVARLALSNKGLNGTIPSGLGGLEMLTYLNLRSNDLTGSIPSTLGNLGNLTYLNLHTNQLSGSIPDLSTTMLEELYLANNYDETVEGSGLTGNVPTWLNGMTGMRELWLWGNRLSGTIPDLSGMISLQKLKLSSNNLTGGIPTTLGTMTNLKWLIINSNPLGGTIPDLSGMTSLTHLWLHSNELTGSAPAGDMLPPNVDDLNLRDNMLTGQIPDLSGLDMATRVRLHNNMLSGEVPATLGDLDRLRQLWLHGNQFTSIAAELGDLSDTLIEIALSSNSWTDDACVPTALANVATNDYADAGLEVCGSDDGS